MRIFNKVSLIVLVVLFAFGLFGTVNAQTASLTPPLISITTIPYPLALPESGPVAYDYTVLNVGIVEMSNVMVIDNACAGVSFVSGDTDGDSRLDVNETWKYRCEKTLSQTSTSTVTATGRANGFTAVDTANATIIVGVPLPPPLIHLEKTPSVFVLPAGGGGVTYTYIVTNLGPTPLSNVTVTDDKCTAQPSRISGQGGDINGNNLLEADETWSFICQTTLFQTTTNTGIAQGGANGLTATDSASSTVVVSSPGSISTSPNFPNTGSVPMLPNTGYTPLEKSVPWHIVIPTGILFILLSFYLARTHEKQLKNPK